MASPTASRRIKRIQRNSIGLITLGCAVNYIDRSTLSVANPLIRHDLGLSHFRDGAAAVGLPLGVCRISAPRRRVGRSPGSAQDARRRHVRLVTPQALGSLVGNFWEFVGARVFLGLGESPQFSGLVRVVRDWYNVRERGLATGIGLCGSKLGPALAPLVLTALMLAFGWRWMFIIMGAVGIGVSLIWSRSTGNPSGSI